MLPTPVDHGAFSAEPGGLAVDRHSPRSLNPSPRLLQDGCRCIWSVSLSTITTTNLTVFLRTTPKSETVSIFQTGCGHSSPFKHSGELRLNILILKP